MIKINELSNELFTNLKLYITSNSQFNPYVLKNVVDNKYPLVVFENNTNLENSRTIDNYSLERERALSFEINIYATNINEYDSSDICDELAQLVTDVMQGYCKMQGGIDAKLKNINTAKATQYVLHFNCKWFMNKNIIY